MQTVAAVSDRTRSAFDQVREKVLEVFPDSDAELRPSTFRDEGGMIIIHTNLDGFNRRYDLIAPVRRFLKKLTKKHRGVAFGFDVVIG